MKTRDAKKRSRAAYTLETEIIPLATHIGDAGDANHFNTILEALKGNKTKDVDMRLAVKKHDLTFAKRAWKFRRQNSLTPENIAVFLESKVPDIKELCGRVLRMLKDLQLNDLCGQYLCIYLDRASVMYQYLELNREETNREETPVAKKPRKE